MELTRDEKATIYYCKMCKFNYLARGDTGELIAFSELPKRQTKNKDACLVYGWFVENYYHGSFSILFCKNLFEFVEGNKIFDVSKELII